MKLEQTFTVAAAADVVWEALIDVTRVAPCLPGAALTDGDEEGVFKGEFKVKIGPTTAAYTGALKLEHLDSEARVATMSARGTDKRGNGGATATIVSSVRAEGGGTRVDVDTDFAITGKLARFGRGGMIQDVSNRLLREFAANLQEDLAGGPAPGPAGDAPAASPDGSSALAGAAAPGRRDGPGPGSDTPDTFATDASTADTPAFAPGVPPAPTQATTPRPPRAPSEPLDGGGLIAGVLADRLKAAGPGVLIGFALGVLAARRWEIRRR